MTLSRHVQLKQSADRLDRMAGALDVDLETHLLRGELPADLLPDMVLRCAACPNPDHCSDWLAGSVANEPPEYCRNKSVLSRLRDSRTAEEEQQ